MVLILAESAIAGSSGSDTLTVAENTVDGTVLGTLILPDPTSAPQLGGKKLKTGYDCKIKQMLAPSAHAASVFTVVNKTRLVLAKSRMDFEADGEIQSLLEIGCTDTSTPPLTTVSNITVQLSNSNEAPQVQLSSAYTIAHTATNGRSVYDIRVPENASALTTIGQLLITDADNCPYDRCYPWQYHKATLEGSSLMRLEGEALVLVSALDYEAVKTELATISVTDSNGETTKTAVNLHVANINEMPTSIHLSGGDRFDSSVLGVQWIGNLSVVDEDADSNVGYTYEVISVVNPRQQTILSPPAMPFVASKTQLYTSSSVSTSPGSYTVTIRASDRQVADNSLIASFTLMATEKNTVPQAIVLSPSVITLRENAVYGRGNTTVANISVVDENNNVACHTSDSCKQTHTCQLQALGCFTAQQQQRACTEGVNPFPFSVTGSASENDSLRISIDGKAGAFDFETLSSYRLTLTCIDNGAPPLSVTQELRIQIADANDSPNSIQLVTGTGGVPVISEDAPDGFVVGMLLCKDQDGGQQHSYTIVDTAAPFDIQGNQLRVQRSLSSAALDFETSPEFSLQVRVTDSGVPPLTHTETVRVKLKNSNEAPEQIMLRCGCATSPCLNKGTCIPVGTEGLDYLCSCNYGFRGENCQIPPNPSMPHASKIPDECLNIHPSTQIGTKLARVHVVDQDAQDAHKFKMHGPAASRLTLVNGVLILVDVLGAQASKTWLTLAATDSGSLTVERTLALAASLCFKGSGQCSQHANCSTSQQGIIACVCLPGYVGDGQSCIPGIGASVTLCGTSMCEAPRTCTLSSGTAVCTCPSGMAGGDCKTPDPCNTHRCYNGGRCQPAVEPSQALVAARCNCRNGTFGATCEFTREACSNTTCSVSTEICLSAASRGSSQQGSAVNDVQPSPSYTCARLLHLARIMSGGRVASCRAANIPASDSVLAPEEQFAAGMCLQPTQQLLAAHASLIEHCLSTVIGHQLTVHPITTPPGAIAWGVADSRDNATASNPLVLAIHDESMMQWSTAQISVRVGSRCSALEDTTGRAGRCCNVFARTQLFAQPSTMVRGICDHG